MAETTLSSSPWRETEAATAVARPWRLAQTAVFLVGVGISASLLAAPRVGIHAFWNVLIPLAPALFAVVPGLWRNVCPLASLAIVARRAPPGRRLRLSPAAHRALSFGGLALLLLLVPLRHVVLDLSGPATAAAIAGLAVLAAAASRWAEGRSGWCAGLCPVHPVERLYGAQPLRTFQNAHCESCSGCVASCADWTPAQLRHRPHVRPREPAAALLLAGGFPGFIWGWFQVPDGAAGIGWEPLARAFSPPLLGFAATATLFWALRRLVPRKRAATLPRAFAAAALAVYYYYRLPALFGFGPFPGDGRLVDLTGSLPAWFPIASRAVTTAFFVWWLLARTATDRAWSVRPRPA